MRDEKQGCFMNKNMENPLKKLENIELYICFIFLAFFV